MTQEQWRTIPGHSGYSVSNMGRVRRDAKGPGATVGLILRATPCNGGGYRMVGLYENGRRSAYGVHRLVALAWLGPRPSGMETCHNNGDGTDNRLENLRYDTPAANQADRVPHGTSNRGTRNAHCKLDAEKVRAIRRARAEGDYLGAIADRFGVGISTVQDIAKGRTWAWLDAEPEQEAAS